MVASEGVASGVGMGVVSGTADGVGVGSCVTSSTEEVISGRGVTSGSGEVTGWVASFWPSSRKQSSTRA